MSEIEELHGRITAAMDRISSGLGALEAAPNGGGEDADLAQALDEERLANAQLEERLKKLKGEVAAMEEAAPVAGGMSSDSSELEALRAEVELLRNEVGNPDEAAGLKAEVARLTAALDAAHDAPAETDPLEEKISGLTTENAELQSEITRLQDQVAGAGSVAPAGSDAGSPAGELARQNDMLVKLDTELQRLRGANEELVSANEALRAASAQGLADPDLINNAMAAEIEGLRAAQATDQAQVNAVLARLEPLLEGAAQMPDMPEGEEQ